MIICHCWGVSDREIRRAIRNGARTPEDLARVCRAGSGCGGCQPFLKRLLVIEARRPGSAPPEAASAA